MNKIYIPEHGYNLFNSFRQYIINILYEII